MASDVLLFSGNPEKTQGTNAVANTEGENNFATGVESDTNK